MYWQAEIFPLEWQGMYIRVLVTQASWVMAAYFIPLCCPYHKHFLFQLCCSQFCELFPALTSLMDGRK